MQAKLNRALLETKFAPISVSQVLSEGVFEGYASLFGELDAANDIVVPGAFSDSLKRRGAGQIKMLFQHDPSEVVGVWSQISEDHKGLKVKGRLLTELRRGKELFTLMRAGALDGLSIGFRTAASRTDPKTGIRRIARLDLYEISLVTFPMLSTARVGDVKAQLPTARQIERCLTREAGMTRSQARALTRNGLKSLAPGPVRDARSDTFNAALAARIRHAAARLRPEQENQTS